MKRCENCEYYSHKPNILGGIAECEADVKSLTTFWPNDACDKFTETKEDKLKAQNDCCNQHLDGAIQLRK